MIYVIFKKYFLKKSKLIKLTCSPWTGYVFHWHHHFDGFFSSNSFIYQIHTKLSSNHRIHKKIWAALRCDFTGFSHGKNSKEVSKSFHIFYNLKVDRWHQATLFLKLFFVIFKSVTQQVFTYFYNFWPKKPDFSGFLWEIVFVYKSQIFFAVRKLQVSVKNTIIHNWLFW